MIQTYGLWVMSPTSCSRQVGTPPRDQLQIQYYYPTPYLSFQQGIVTRIEEKQKLVKANKRLIEIYEQKIKDKIAEVWGEEPTT